MQPPPPPLSVVTGQPCQWCRQPMNSADARCNHCGRLRKDIYSDKVKSYIFSIIGGLSIGVSVALWKTTKQNEFDYYESTTTTDNTVSYVLLAIGIVGAIIGIYF